MYFDFYDIKVILLKFILLLTSHEFLIFFISIGYWNINKVIFRQALIILLIATFISAHLKELFQIPPLPNHSSWSFPSGHMLTSSVFWGYICIKFHKLWLYIVSAFILALIAYSLVFFGHHLIQDVLASFGFASITLFIYHKTCNKIGTILYKLPIWISVLIVAIILYIWLLLIPGGFHNHLLASLSALLAITFASLLEQKYCQFKPYKKKWKNLIASSIGILSTFSLYSIGKSLTAISPFGIYYHHSIIFFIVILWVMLIWPMIAWPNKWNKRHN